MLSEHNKTSYRKGKKKKSEWKKKDRTCPLGGKKKKKKWMKER